MRTYVFIDAANLFYGGLKSLGWSIDYQRLNSYLRERYDAKRILFFGGIDTYKFPFDYLTQDAVSVSELKLYLEKTIEKESLTAAHLTELKQYLSRARFYERLQEFGYELILKPVKRHYGPQGELTRKANCDVDMTLELLRNRTVYDRAIVMSGDGDFLPIFKFLRNEGKEILIFARGQRTAKEIRRFAGGSFTDFSENLRPHIERISI